MALDSVSRVIELQAPLDVGVQCQRRGGMGAMEGELGVAEADRSRDCRVDAVGGVTAGSPGTCTLFYDIEGKIKTERMKSTRACGTPCVHSQPRRRLSRLPVQDTPRLSSFCSESFATFKLSCRLLRQTVFATPCRPLLYTVKFRLQMRSVHMLLILMPVKGMRVAGHTLTRIKCGVNPRVGLATWATHVTIGSQVS